MIGPDLSIFKACSGSTRRPRSDGHLWKSSAASPRRPPNGGSRVSGPGIPRGVHTMTHVD